MTCINTVNRHWHLKLSPKEAIFSVIVFAFLMYLILCIAFYRKQFLSLFLHS